MFGSIEKLRMPSTNRISVTTASATHQKVLEYEAALTGRSLSSLASSLLEEIVNQKIQSSQLHPTAIRLSEELVKAREWTIKGDHESELEGLKVELDNLERIWGNIIALVKLPYTQQLLSAQTKLVQFNEERAVVQVSGNWKGMVESRAELIEAAMKEYLEEEADYPELEFVEVSRLNAPPMGYFTDRVWAEPETPKTNNREEELIAYGMRYGLMREVAEDLYEQYCSSDRRIIRELMRDTAGADERLPEEITDQPFDLF